MNKDKERDIDGVELMKKDISDVITNLVKAANDELFQKTEEELEEYWFFRWDNKASIAQNVYQFHSMLELYGSACRRWEEEHDGSCCVVERVRDKYLMPKIKQFVEKISERCPLYMDYKKSCTAWRDRERE